MKKLNNIAAAFVMMAILILGTTAANAGILVGDIAGSETKTSQTCDVADEKVNWGIIIRDLVGIIIRDLVDIPETTTTTNCGIIIRD